MLITIDFARNLSADVMLLLSEEFTDFLLKRTLRSSLTHSPWKFNARAPDFDIGTMNIYNTVPQSLGFKPQPAGEHSVFICCCQILTRFERAAAMMHCRNVVQLLRRSFGFKRPIVATHFLVLVVCQRFACMRGRVCLNDIDRVLCRLKRREPRQNLLCSHDIPDSIREIPMCPLGDAVNPFKRGVFR